MVAPQEGEGLVVEGLQAEGQTVDPCSGQLAVAQGKFLDYEATMNGFAASLAPLTFASHAYEKFHLLMPLFACRRWEGVPAPREGQTLAWVRPDRLRDYPMPPADIPLIPILRDWL